MNKTLLASIHTGLWINWDSGGIVKGATLTLTTKDGALMTSLITAFLAITSTQLWKISCFFIHRFRSTPSRKDGLHHQRQVILRNSATAGDTVWLFSNQARRWWRVVPHSGQRTLLWLAFAVVYIAIFTTLAIVVPALIVSGAGNERLVKSDGCGWWYEDKSRPNSLNGFALKALVDNEAASTLVRSCYKANPDLFQCGTLKTPRIEWKASHNVTCGFDPSICFPTANSGFKMDTGPLDSREIFGINTSPGNTISFRRVTTCSNLIYNDTIRQLQKPSGKHEDSVWVFYYGVDKHNRPKVTYNYDFRAIGTATPYTIYSTLALLQRDSSWIPIPELNRTDADVSWVMVNTNGVSLTEPCDDNIFRTNSSKNSLGLYALIYPNSPIACMEQYQFCNPQNQNCTPLTGQDVATNKALYTDMGFSNTQLEAVRQIARSLVGSSIAAIVLGRNERALLASERLSGIIQMPLPDNQWELEASYWFETGLARIQQQILEYATGPKHKPPGVSVEPPSQKISQSFCQKQLVREIQHTISFSVAGMCTTFIIGACIIFVSLAMENFMVWFDEHVSKAEYSRSKEWAYNDKLQLHRLYLEDRNIETASDVEGSIPLVGGKVLFNSIPRLTLDEKNQEQMAFVEHYDMQPKREESIGIDKSASFSVSGQKISRKPVGGHVEF